MPAADNQTVLRCSGTLVVSPRGSLCGQLRAESSLGNPQAGFIILQIPPEMSHFYERKRFVRALAAAPDRAARGSARQSRLAEDFGEAQKPPMTSELHGRVP